MFPVFAEQRRHPRQVRVAQGLRHRVAGILQTTQRPGHRGIAALVCARHARDRITRDSRLVGVANQRLALECRGERRIQRHRLDAHVGIAKAQAMKSSQRRRVLVLLPSGQLCLDRLDLPGLIGHVLLPERLLAHARQRTDQRDAERARAAESRPRRRVAAGGEGEAAQHREAAQRRREQRQLAGEETAGVRAFECFAQLFGDEAQQRAAQVQCDVGAQADGSVHHHAAFARRKRRDVGPASGEVEPQRRGRVKRGRQIAASHCSTRHAATVGSSPRISMRTPRTRLFIAWTPRP